MSLNFEILANVWTTGEKTSKIFHICTSQRMESSSLCIPVPLSICTTLQKTLQWVQQLGILPWLLWSFNGLPPLHRGLSAHVLSRECPMGLCHRAAACWAPWGGKDCLWLWVELTSSGHRSALFSGPSCCRRHDGVMKDLQNCSSSPGIRVITLDNKNFILLWVMICLVKTPTLKKIHFIIY